MKDITVKILEDMRSDMRAIRGDVASLRGDVGTLDARMASLEGEVQLHGIALRGVAVELTEAKVERREMRGMLADMALLLRQVAEDHEHRIAALEVEAD